MTSGDPKCNAVWSTSRSDLDQMGATIFVAQVSSDSRTVAVAFRKYAIVPNQD